MTTEQIKKLDYELFYLKDRIISNINWYNSELERLEKHRPSRFYPPMELILKEKELKFFK